MPRKDYMMRYFEQLGVVLAALLGFRARGQYEEGLEVIRKTLNELPDFYYELVGLSPLELLDHISDETKFPPEKTEMIATLLYEEAEFLNLSGYAEQAADTYRKALLLLRNIDKKTGIYSVERSDRISRCKKMLNE